jgi:hypothetical protein
MKLWWASLKPLERRWAVVFGSVIFLLLNYFFIWGHFGDLKRDAFRTTRAQQTNDLYMGEVRRTDEYKRKIRELQVGGDTVLPEDQAIDFLRFYNSRALSNSIMTTSQGNLVTTTNDVYSLRQQMTVGVQASETNLVNFLYSLSAGTSMMRVRAMSLHPDPSHLQLGASITIIADYQKKAPVARTNAVPTKVVNAAPAPAKTILPLPVPPAVKAFAEKTNTNAPTVTNKLAGALARPISTNKMGSPTAKKP